MGLRQRAGLTQTELAEAIGLQQATIASWEWSETPPRSKDLPTLAKVLGVHMEDLLFREDRKAVTTRPGPVGEVQRVFEEVRQLPRKQQRKVLEMVTALLEKYKRSSDSARSA